MTNATVPLTADEQFFFVYAGYSYDPKNESEMEGRRRSAIESAKREALFLEACKLADVGIEWADDSDAAERWTKDGEKFERCESATIWFRDDAGEVHYLSHLGGITDADVNYRRVIRAELAAEYADRLQTLIDQSKT